MAATLGQYLMSIRTAQRMTLRDVEMATKKAVSNAYLSQIENDKIQQPSPNILHSLAELYGVDYQQLMKMAGYVGPPGQRRQGQTRGILAEQQVTPEEEAELLRYLQFMRSRGRRQAP